MALVIVEISLEDSYLNRDIAEIEKEVWEAIAESDHLTPIDVHVERSLEDA